MVEIREVKRIEATGESYIIYELTFPAAPLTIIGFTISYQLGKYAFAVKSLTK